MTHKRHVAAAALGTLALVLATACAAVPAAPAGGQVMGPDVLGPTFDSLTVPAIALFPAAANEMRSMSLAQAAERLTTEQLYNSFYMGAGGCDRHHDLYLQEDLGANEGAANGN